jgi:hypothetical protein
MSAVVKIPPEALATLSTLVVAEAPLLYVATTVKPGCNCSWPLGIKAVNEVCPAIPETALLPAATVAEAVYVSQVARLVHTWNVEGSTTCPGIGLGKSKVLSIRGSVSTPAKRVAAAIGSPGIYVSTLYAGPTMTGGSCGTFGFAPPPLRISSYTRTEGLTYDIS